MRLYEFAYTDMFMTPKFRISISAFASPTLPRARSSFSTFEWIWSNLIWAFLTGYAYRCDVSHIKVKTVRTGITVEGQPQYQVIVTNECPCAQSSVYLRCLGFSTVQPINPGVLKVKGDSCLINNGRPIVKGKPVSFKYSFLQPTDLIPQRSKISCWCAL